LNLTTFLKTVAVKYGPKPAVISGATRLSYGDLDRASNQVAHALQGLGIEPGDRVAFLLGNSPEFIVAFFGVVKIGAVAVPLDSKYKLTELKALFADCRPKLLFTEDSCLQSILPALSEFPFIRHVVDLGEGTQGVPRFGDMLAGNPATAVGYAPGLEDTAVIAYTC
jgi:long-chain acyl-CoA synthetase